MLLEQAAEYTWTQACSSEIATLSAVTTPLPAPVFLTKAQPTSIRLRFPVTRPSAPEEASPTVPEETKAAFSQSVTARSRTTLVKAEMVVVAYLILAKHLLLIQLFLRTLLSQEARSPTGIR